MIRRAGAVLLAAITACGYTSEYVPPDDWRVRPVYQGNEVVVVGPAGPPLCADEAPAQPRPQGPPPPVMVIDDRGYWTPSVEVHIVHSGPHPHVHHPGHPLHPPGPHDAVLAGLSSSDSGGDGGGEGGEALAAILLALALLASSGVAVGLAADPAEQSGAVVAAVDRINQLNDVARRKMAECVARLAAQPAPKPNPVPAPTPVPTPAPATAPVSPPVQSPTAGGPLTP